MRRLRHRIVRSPLSALLARATPLLLTATLAGCAATSATSSIPVAGSQARAARAALEGDGLPAQLAPLWAARQSDDDAAEPYSPLYGSRASYRLGATAGQWSPAKEDAIIAQAITAHEMRRP
jgi:hypothetical protein